jgi:hypothetical protein
VALTVAAALGVPVAGVQQAVSGLIGGDRWNWAEMAVAVVLYAVLLPCLWEVLARGRARGWWPRNPAGQVRERRSDLVTRAVRAGAVPADVGPAAWRRALDRELRELRDERWLGIGFAVLGVGLIAAAAVVADDNSPGVWAVAVVVAAEGVAVDRWNARRLAAVRVLPGGR